MSSWRRFTKGRISAGDRFLNGAAVTKLSRLGLISVEGGTSAKNVTVLLGRVFNKHVSVLGTSGGVLWSQRVVSVPARWIRCKPECLSTCELGCLPVCRLIFGLSLFPLDLHKLELLSLPISDCVASSLNSCHIPPKVEFAALQWWVVISGFAQEGYHMETELNSGP